MSEREDVGTDPVAARAPIATRAPAPTPRRLSRKALIALTGVSAIGVAAALGYSLSASHHTQVPQETVSVDRRNTDALADAPKDYGDVARTVAAGVGAPSANTEPITPPSAGAGSTPAGPANQEALQDRQHRRQQRDSARASKLLPPAMAPAVPLPWSWRRSHRRLPDRARPPESARPGQSTARIVRQPS